MSEPPRRVGVWCAVSSKPQAADDKSSLQDQEDAGRRFAESVGEVVAVYRVPGHSRTMWRWEDAEAQMPAYRQLREDVEAGRLDVLWCLESSRLGRDAALVQQVVSLLASNGAELYRADAPHQLGQKSTGHRFLDAFGAVMAEQESDLRKHRHRSGMRGRIKRGLFSAHPPHGYCVVRNEQGDTVGYEQDAGAEAIRLMTRLFLEGHSYTEIRRRMDASGHPAPRGQHWQRTTISTALHNDSYAGFPSFGSITYEGPGPSPCYEPIWDAATHAAVIRERERRYAGPYVRPGGGPLTGVAVCARCGKRMARMESRGHWYLRCATHNSRNQYGDGRECHSNYVREDRCVRLLADYIKALGTGDTIDRVFARMQQQQHGDEARDELMRLHTRLGMLEGQRERLALAFASGDMDVQVYRKADDALAAQQETAQARAVELERYILSLPDLNAQRRHLRWLFQNFDRIMEESEPATISKVLQEAQFQVLVEDGTPWVDWPD